MEYLVMLTQGANNMLHILVGRPLRKFVKSCGSLYFMLFYDQVELNGLSSFHYQLPHQQKIWVLLEASLETKNKFFFYPLLMILHYLSLQGVVWIGHVSPLLFWSWCFYFFCLVKLFCLCLIWVCSLIPIPALSSVLVAN